MTTTRRDQQLALIWHTLEFCVVVLLALSIVGLWWSIDHYRQPEFVESRG